MTAVFGHGLLGRALLWLLQLLHAPLSLLEGWLHPMRAIQTYFLSPCLDEYRRLGGGDALCHRILQRFRRTSIGSSIVAKRIVDAAEACMDRLEPLWPIHLRVQNNRLLHSLLKRFERQRHGPLDLNNPPASAIRA